MRNLIKRRLTEAKTAAMLLVKLQNHYLKGDDSGGLFNGPDEVKEAITAGCRDGIITESQAKLVKRYAVR